MSAPAVPAPTEIPDRAASVNPDEIAHFEALGREWWDEWGPMRGLHRINPLRARYIVDILASGFERPGADGPTPLQGLRLLDVGCGAGVLSEALARLGAEVTGVDPAAGNIDIARAHAGKSGLAIDYRAQTAEALAREGAVFDAAIASEVVEHVVDRPAFVATLGQLVRPGGFVIVTTINRTAKSWALAIVGAEYVLRWVARGTHDWRLFVKPEEMAQDFRAAGLEVYDQTGLVYQPLFDEWRLSDDCAVNYFMAAEKPARG